MATYTGVQFFRPPRPVPISQHEQNNQKAYKNSYNLQASAYNEEY